MQVYQLPAAKRPGAPVRQPHPAEVTHLDRAVLRLALIAAGGDTSRLEVIDERTVIVR